MSDLEVEETDQADDEIGSIEEGKLLDYITDEPSRTRPRSRCASVSHGRCSTSTVSPSRTWSPTSR